ncbi:cell division protein FtsK [Apilactobacillus timberlakei]|uniref:DNA translocase FtsK n=2 Tax=Apilactobacillus timberlakei TaxID=2008380 RepID=A0ABY2YTZ0_9LACO|nr:cell division protein FtsK [Apilactobacillus timberlakei]TPR15400.1 cell division protein FtsK [Apilactobacillus timberlakei]TPR17291.1 cell division protein FtsK [Apilactobacillus timberlakei]TPR24174.1 cell division protein FtsK [Apilactobacillus timberlakei]
MIFISLFSYLQLGFLGITINNFFRFFVGDSVTIFYLITLITGIIFLIKGNKLSLNKRVILGVIVTYLGLLMFLSALYFSGYNNNDFIRQTLNIISNDFIGMKSNSSVGGGIIGASSLTIFNFLVSILGAEIISIIMIIVGGLISFNISMNQIFDKFQKHSEKLSAKIGESSQKIGEKVHDINNKKQVKEDTNNKKLNSYNNTPKPKLSGWMDSSKKDTKSVSKKENVEESSDDIKDNDKDYKLASEYNNDNKKSEKVSDVINKQNDDFNGPIIENNSETNDEEYDLPSSNLLSEIKQTDQSDEYKAIDKNTVILKKTLNSFGVDAEIKNVSLGPSVTEYELHPAIGVKVSKIVNLADDLALALAAKDIRIEAPIPGKSLIGIEVPNKNVSTVSFKDVVDSQDKNHSLMSVPLGRNVNGDVISTDLTKLPHLLIAGSTGSGKSVAINGIITSILLNAKPSEVKMMLIDPKKVELGVYNGIPHLLTPVVSEPKKAARSLNKVVTEMEHRYDLFAKNNQRKISSYNKYVKKLNKEDGGDRQTLPYIVVVVDELADLMMTVSNEVESAIIRLAQMGRAAGIHMILATQRPSVDVITGLIKSNVPSRIAFAVSSGVDSRTIIDTNGAEKLLGRGDMLYLPVDKNKPIRIQGAFISDDDVENVVDYIKEQQTAEYDNSMMVSDEDIKREEEVEDQDELFGDALKFVIHEQKASTSLLQRNFRIGYNRAARIIDDLEQRGYIGPQEGSKPRQVYKQSNDDSD